MTAAWFTVSRAFWVSMRPDRDPPRFTPTAYEKVPLPARFDPFVTVIHELLLSAVHRQPVCVVIEAVNEPPNDDTDSVVGVTANVHSTCVTVNVWPAIVIVPVRLDPLKLENVNATVPLPLPLDPDVICSQPTFEAAVHVQPAPVVTAIAEPVPLSLPTVCEVGVIEYEQDGVPAAWFTVNV